MNHSGMLPCFLGGDHSRLDFRMLRARHNRNRLSCGFDDVVQPSVSCSDIGVAELRFVLVHQTLTNAFFVFIGNGADLSAVDDVDRPFRTHDRKLSRRPSDVVVTLQVLA